jgi:hypothetical protein
MPDLVAEMNAAAENVRQVHLDHIRGLGVTGKAMAALWQSEGIAPFGVATIEQRPDGSFLFGPGALHVIQPVTYGGELIDLVAWRSMTPGRWLCRMGSAWCLGEDHLYADSPSLTEPHAPAIVATPLQWLTMAGDAFCVLNWDAPEVRGLVAIDSIRCADKRLSQTLLAAISKPVRLPRIVAMEAIANAA